jgi:hypothetical protein
MRRSRPIRKPQFVSNAELEQHPTPNRGRTESHERAINQRWPHREAACPPRFLRYFRRRSMTDTEASVCGIVQYDTRALHPPQTEEFRPPVRCFTKGSKTGYCH